MPPAPAPAHPGVANDSLAHHARVAVGGAVPVSAALPVEDVAEAARMMEEGRGRMEEPELAQQEQKDLRERERGRHKGDKHVGTVTYQLYSYNFFFPPILRCAGIFWKLLRPVNFFFLGNKLVAFKD